MVEDEPIARAIIALWGADFDTAEIARLLGLDEPRVARLVRAALDAKRELAGLGGAAA